MSYNFQAASEHISAAVNVHDWSTEHYSTLQAAHYDDAFWEREAALDKVFAEIDRKLDQLRALRDEMAAVIASLES